MEFWSALLGAVVGGALSLAGGLITTSRALKGQRELARIAAAEERAAAASASNRETAIELLDSLAHMRKHLGGLGEMIWSRRVRSSIRMDTDPPERVPEAIAALDDLRRLEASRARLLPDEISQRWYELTVLIDELRGSLMTSEQDDPVWTDQRRNRAGVDVANYLAFVQRTLIQFVKDQTVIAPVDPPVLRRESLETWSAD